MDRQTEKILLIDYKILFKININSSNNIKTSLLQLVDRVIIIEMENSRDTKEEAFTTKIGQ